MIKSSSPISSQTVDSHSICRGSPSLRALGFEFRVFLVLRAVATQGYSTPAILFIAVGEKR